MSTATGSTCSLGTAPPPCPTLEWGVGTENASEEALGPQIQGPDAPLSDQTNTQQTGSKPCLTETGRPVVALSWGTGGGGQE